MTQKEKKYFYVEVVSIILSSKVQVLTVTLLLCA